MVRSGAFQLPQRPLPRASRRLPEAARQRPPVTPPPDFHSRLLTKLKYLREDAHLYPHDSHLAIALTECYLQLAVSQREKAPVEAEQWAMAATMAARKIQLMPAVAHIQQALSDWHNLEWAEPGAGGISRLFAVETVQRNEPPMFAAFPGGIDPAMQGGRSYPGGPPVDPLLENRVQHGLRVPGSGSPYALGMGTGVLPTYPMGGAGSPPMIMPPPQPAPALRPSERARLVGQLSREWKEHPEETRAAYRLARLLENEAMARGRGVPRVGARSAARAAFNDYRQALAIYRKLAARRAPRQQRVFALLAAASLCGRMDAWGQQLQILREASEVAPYEVPVWVELHRAALRAGDLAESRHARLEAERWLFPDLTT